MKPILMIIIALLFSACSTPEFELSDSNKRDIQEAVSKALQEFIDKLKPEETEYRSYGWAYASIDDCETVWVQAPVLQGNIGKAHLSVRCKFQSGMTHGYDGVKQYWEDQLKQVTIISGPDPISVGALTGDKYRITKDLNGSKVTGVARLVTDGVSRLLSDFTSERISGGQVRQADISYDLRGEEAPFLLSMDTSLSVQKPVIIPKNLFLSEMKRMIEKEVVTNAAEVIAATIGAQ